MHPMDRQMRRMLQASLLVAFAVAMTGCASSRAPSAASSAASGAIAARAVATTTAATTPAAPTPAPATEAMPLPMLRLSPALLERDASLSQRLTVTPLDGSGRAPQVVDVQLEIDREGLRLAAFAIGQRVLLMQWDGRELKTQRHPRLPVEVDEQRMLRDMTLVYWPAAALRGALPRGWTLRGTPEHHELIAGADLAHPVIDVAVSGDLAGDSRIVITNQREHYRLLIESRPLESGR
ncbi:MAG: DUF3261 domain-containing protein [Rubrivivax sp.]|nr:MAG: DUF3261 domain-containing protein [Rubrivivax sp.]